MYICRIPVTMEVGLRPVEKAEHQLCCGRIPSESGRNRNPALDSATPKTGTKTGMCNLARTQIAVNGLPSSTTYICCACVDVYESLPT